ncbi:TPA: AAA family ATPase [Burkholderia vietnamiensis]|uniref:AAA family ATPase n=1 Tax=Burkholderia vietnamiensis TaxID=60552 RepID=A0AAW7TBG9_BURVI|nr:AAA family ATPase [Burkholderia vietnamiensis]MCA8068446.1 AAA family ATPase [Burkholderia vietnamiensis]MDN7798855.1 AAA family ATPase [Burkholderia vietnamiensis]HDR9061602.1 AAA family ATPase [Burkholderia vietnamiensis]HDR9188522.1 AAA family ATPase [Burkholderia vietnamiensis]HDR9256992.1 AAA family ATPase [Burkholderia vietnamiensis]
MLNLQNMTYPSQLTHDQIKMAISPAHQFPANGKNGLILYGPYGTGKTTVAGLLPAAIEAKQSGGTPLVRYEACSSSNNGVSLVESILTQIAHVPTTGTFHYIILDEVDNLTPGAMQQLKSAMNRRHGSQNHDAVFIMTTNHLDKIDSGVISRSRPISFEPMSETVWIPLARQELLNSGVSNIDDVTDGFIRRRIVRKGNNPRAILDNCRQMAYLLSNNSQLWVDAQQP